MVILTILRFNEINGVSTFNFTLLNELKEHTIYFTFSKTKVNKESLIFKMFNKFKYIEYEEIKNYRFDIILTNYNEPDLRNYGRVLHFQHNLMNKESFNEYSDVLFTFSERGFDFLNHNKKILIRNFIDLKRFYFVEPEIKPEKWLLFDSRNNQNLISNILAASTFANSYVSYLGSNLNYNIESKFNIEDSIKNSNIVFASGRSAIESMAMGKFVVVYNNLNFNGDININNFNIHQTTNFSGWIKESNFKYNYEVNHFDILNSIKNYNLDSIYRIRELIEKEFNVLNFLQIIKE